MIFNELHQQIDAIIQELVSEDLVYSHLIKTELFLKKLNKSSGYITVHDVESFRPIYINDAMRDFYGFKSNRFKGINYLYYVNTIHVSSYSSLIKSVSYFRKNDQGYLDLPYKLLSNKKEWISMVGTTKTLIWNQNNKPKYAISLLKEVNVNSVMDYEITQDDQKKLTQKEKQIAALLKINTPKPQIQEVLNISSSTLHTHQKKIFKKLKISKIHELIVLDENYIRPELMDREDLYDDLTKKEKQVLELLSIGLSKKEIALCLNNAESTINTHTKKIFKKLGVSSVAEILRINQEAVYFE